MVEVQIVRGNPMPKYTDQDIIEAVKSSISLAEVLKKINLVPVGGNYMTLKIKIKKLNLDIDHFKGQGWNKDTFTVALTDKRSNFAIKKHLISVLGHKCQNCLLDKWLGKPIPLELEHINGNSLDNELTNLKLLCPNCHSFTPTYRRKK